ncbi:MAG: penicillin-binding protein activator [Myxococcota bacterium]
MTTRRTLYRPALILLCLAALASPATTACAAKTQGGAVVETALSQPDRDTTIDKLERGLDSASEANAPWIMVHLGEQYRLKGDNKQARKQFKAVPKANSDAHRASELGEALVSLAEGDTAAMQTLREVSEKVATSTQNADRYAQLSLAAAASGDDASAATFKSKALKYAEADREVLTRLTQAFTPVGAPALATDGPLAERLEEAILAGRRGAVERLAAELAGTAKAGSDDAMLAKYATRRLDVTVDTRTIAVLLPLSGKYKTVGTQIRSALEMGWGGGGNGRKLVFVDVGDSEATAIAAAEKASLTLGAVAIVGPLRKEYAGPVAQVAQATATPMIGLHQNGDAATDRSWVIDGLATPKIQAQGLVKYVMTQKGMKSFAIFAPDSPYGRASADAFQAAVEARGGRITSRVHYSNTSADLVGYAKTLAGKDYKARAAEFARKKKEIAAMGGDPARASLAPKMDFDAIFVPDNARRIPVAAAALSHEEFPVGTFQVVKGGRTIPLLGLSGWNNTRLVTSGGPYVRRGVFTDVYVERSDASKALRSAFSSKVGHEPNSLEAQTWTVGRVLATASAADVTDRTTFRSALFQASLSKRSATGASGVDDENRRVDHRLRFMSLSKNGIYELQ